MGSIRYTLGGEELFLADIFDRAKQTGAKGVVTLPNVDGLSTLEAVIVDGFDALKTLLGNNIIRGHAAQIYTADAAMEKEAGTVVAHVRENGAPGFRPEIIRGFEVA